MYIAAVNAIRDLAKMPIPEEVRRSYPKEKMTGFGVDYILPKPTDPRLKDYIAPRVAQAAIDSEVARLPYPAHYPKLKQ